MDGGLANFELRGESGAGKQAARAQSLKSTWQSIGGPHQRDLPGGKCLLLPVCISKFIESRGDLLIGACRSSISKRPTGSFFKRAEETTFSMEHAPWSGVAERADGRYL